MITGLSIRIFDIKLFNSGYAGARATQATVTEDAASYLTKSYLEFLNNFPVIDFMRYHDVHTAITLVYNKLFLSKVKNIKWQK